MKKPNRLLPFVFLGCLIIGIGIFTYPRIQESNQKAMLRNNRLSTTKNVTAIPLIKSPSINDWYFYESRFGNYSFSFPKDWVIKECQIGEDCEFYSATRIDSKTQNASLQISFFSPGTSQCIFNLVSDGEQINKHYLDVLKYGTPANPQISMPIKHRSDCFEFIGKYSSTQEKEIIQKVLSSFRFVN